MVPKRLIGATKSLQNVVTATNGSEILVATLDMLIAVSGDGSVLSTRPIDAPPGTESSLVWTGDSYLFIRRKGFSAVAERLDHLGNSLSTAITLDAGVSSAASINGVSYLAGRNEARGIVAFRLAGGNVFGNAAGDVLSVTPTVQTAPVLASDGVDFLAGWTEEMARSHSFSVRRVSRAATPLDAQQTDLGPVEQPERRSSLSIDATESHQSVACASLTCLAVWEDSGNLRGQMIVAGQASAAPFTIGRGRISDQAVVWNGHEFFIIWSSGPLNSATVSSTGAVSVPVQLTKFFEYRTPKIAWDGRRYLLMMTFDAINCDCPGSNSSISFSALSPDGTLFGDDAFFATFRDAHLAASDHDFMVIYDQGPLSSQVISEVATRRIVVTENAVQVGAPVALFHWFDATASGITWNGQDYVAAWRYGSGSTGWVSSMRISPAGVSDRRVSTSGVGDRQATPAIRANAAGESVIVVSESPSPGEPARLYAYPDRELTRAPSAPPAPFDVYSVRTASGAIVSWRSAMPRMWRASSCSALMTETSLRLRVPVNARSPSVSRSRYVCSRSTQVVFRRLVLLLRGGAPPGKKQNVVAWPKPRGGREERPEITPSNLTRLRPA